jgi:hypothetical protein
MFKFLLYECARYCFHFDGYLLQLFLAPSGNLSIVFQSGVESSPHPSIKFSNAIKDTYLQQISLNWHSDSPTGWHWSSQVFSDSNSATEGQMFLLLLSKAFPQSSMMVDTALENSMSSMSDTDWSRYSVSTFSSSIRASSAFRYFQP